MVFKIIANIKSANDYAQLLIEGILEVEDTLPVNERLSDSMIQFWLDEIRKTVDTVYNEYITGKCETYLLDGDEMKQTFKTAHGLYIDETLIGMLDKGLLSLSVGEDGEILYSLSDEGKDLGELMFGKAKLN
jgi:hypothetical protein